MTEDDWYIFTELWLTNYEYILFIGFNVRTGGQLWYYHFIPPTSVYTLHITRYYHNNDVASGSEITPCNKIDKPLVVYRFSGNVITSITTLRTE